jgi:type I restriction enzyme S subunit
MTNYIPAGYKLTDIGIIPEDWNLVTYDEAFKFMRTASYSRDQLGLGSTIYIHYGDIHTKWDHFVELSDDLPTIEDNKVNNYSLVEDGDLIVADASEDYEGICKSVEVRNSGSKKAISGLHTFLLRDKGKYFAKGFRGYIHSNILVKSSMDRLATGLKVYGVSKSNLKLIQIPQPPLPEQTAIATALSDVDSLIEKLKILIEKKKNIKQGAMGELLTGKRRLPGFELRHGLDCTPAVRQIGLEQSARVYGC